MSKNLKKIFAMVLSLCMVFSMAIVGFADDEPAEEIDVACSVKDCNGKLALKADSNDIYVCDDEDCDQEYKAFTCECDMCEADECPEDCVKTVYVFEDKVSEGDAYECGCAASRAAGGGCLQIGRAHV